MTCKILSSERSYEPFPEFRLRGQMHRETLSVLTAEHEGLRRTDSRKRPDVHSVASEVDEPIRGKADCRFQHTGLNAAALVGFLSFVERAKNGICRIETRDVVGEGRTAGLWSLRIDKLAQHAGQRLRHGIV